jgi:hypothetical protein
MRPKRRPLKAMRPSRDHPETCGRVGVNFVKSEKRADREPQKRGCLSMARTASCLVPPRVEPAGLFSGFEGLFARLLGRANLVFVGVLLCDMLGSFSVATARRHHRSPAVAPLPAGQDPGWGPSSPYLGTATVTLSSPQKSTPFCEEN